jgi:predicted regulator of Ras-like GTPase activity (Roadblock/LC7/MglB family)
MAEVELETPDSGTEVDADKQNTDITKEPSPIPDNWKDWIPKDIRDTPVITDTKDITSMAKRLVDANNMISKSMKMPVDGDTAGWDEVYKKLGRPESVDGYKVEIPEAIKEHRDEKMEVSFKDTALKIGLNPSQAKLMTDWYYGQVGEQVAAQAEVAKDTISQLKHKWGAAYDERLGIAERVVDQFGNGEVSAAAIKDKADLIELIYNMGKNLLEGQAGGGGDGGALTMSPKEALTKINALQRDKEFMDAHNNRKNPGHQGALDEMTSLFKMAYPEEE